VHRPQCAAALQGGALVLGCTQRFLDIPYSDYFHVSYKLTVAPPVRLASFATLAPI